MVSDTDDILLASLQSGSEDAFKILYNRHWEGVYTMIYRRLGDEEVAKDIVQNIFVNLWTSRNEIRVESSLAPYLNRAARNRAISYYKKNISDMIRDTGFQTEQVQYSPEFDLEVKELEAVINEEIEKMPDTMRRTFVLSRRENKSIREIAAELSLSEQTIKNNISQALDRLRRKTKLFYSEPANLAAIVVILLTKI